MKTLQNSQKSKLILALLGTSIFASTAFSGDIKPSYADIKSKIIQNDRALIIEKRDTLAKNITNKSIVHVSNVFDKIRESNRVQRK